MGGFLPVPSHHQPVGSAHGPARDPGHRAPCPDQPCCQGSRERPCPPDHLEPRGPVRLVSRRRSRTPMLVFLYLCRGSTLFGRMSARCFHRVEVFLRRKATAIGKIGGQESSLIDKGPARIREVGIERGGRVVAVGPIPPAELPLENSKSRSAGSVPRSLLFGGVNSRHCHCALVFLRRKTRS